MPAYRVFLLSVFVAILTLAGRPVVSEEEKSEPPGSVHLSPQAIKLGGVEVKPADSGVLAKTLEATGEIVLNGDKVTHVTPRVAGVVVEVLKTVGDKVVQGEPMAVMLSPDLGKAKIEFFSAKQAHDMARLDLEREKTVHANTGKLLELLKTNPDADELNKAENGSVGENKSKLLTTYAAQRLAKAAWERMQKLKEDQIVSQSAYEVASKENESARAEYRGAFEEISFNYRSRLLQAERAMRVAETAFLNAERYLHILGVSEKEITSLSTEEDADIARFVLKAPMSGTVIERHASNGERLKEDVDCFVIADLSSVWAEISVYTKYLDSVKTMQPVHIKVSGREESHAGKIALVSPIVNEKTRTALVRVPLENAEGKLRPGLFITAAITLAEVKASALVPVDAVQTIKGQTVVFVEEEAGKFTVRPVTLGTRSTEAIEVKEGLKPGTRIVVKNSFIVRAEMEKAAFEAD